MRVFDCLLHALDLLVSEDGKVMFSLGGGEHASVLDTKADEQIDKAAGHVHDTKETKITKIPDPSGERILPSFPLFPRCKSVPSDYSEALFRSSGGIRTKNLTPPEHRNHRVTAVDDFLSPAFLAVDQDRDKIDMSLGLLDGVDGL